MNKYIWCTYRNWSFNILEGIQDLKDWKLELIITTKDCLYDFSELEKITKIVRVDTKEKQKIFSKNTKLFKQILEIKPDTIFYNGWSWFVPSNFLELCPNVVLHPGKLPKDRGGSPIQNQIINGEQWTYANIMQMTEELDSGPIYCKEAVSLKGEADDVWARMVTAGIKLTRQYLKGISEGTLNAISQPKETATTYKRVTKEQSQINFDMSAEEIYNVVRAMNETDPNKYVHPCYIIIKNKQLIIERASLEELPQQKETVKLSERFSIEDLIDLSYNVNEGLTSLYIQDQTGRKVYLRRVRVKTI